MPSRRKQATEEIREYYRTVGRFLELELVGRHDAGYWQRRAEAQTLPDVLELGAGTGRVTRILAPLAGRVVAMDLSMEMLIRARRNLAPIPPNVHFVLADMRELRFACTFDLILAANDPFVHLCTGEERDQVLDHVARHLRPGGLFILDALWLTPLDWEKARSTGGWLRSRSLGAPGAELSVTERWRLEEERPLARVEYEYREGGQVVGRAEFRPRLWTPDEVAERFLAAGLRVRRILGGYDERPWDPSSASGLIVEGELDLHRGDPLLATPRRRGVPSSAQEIAGVLPVPEVSRLRPFEPVLRGIPGKRNPSSADGGAGEPDEVLLRTSGIGFGEPPLQSLPSAVVRHLTQSTPDDDTPSEASPGVDIVDLETGGAALGGG